MTKVRVKISGRRLLMDKMDDETLKGLVTRNSKQVDNDRTFEQIAAAKIYKDDEGRVGLTANMLFASLVAAGTMVPMKGKKNISKADGSSLLPGFFDIEEEFLPFDLPKSGKEIPWKVALYAGRNPATGGAAGLVRPLFLDWSLSVTCEFDEKEIDQSKIKALFEKAGRYHGLGSWRPSCGGRHGKFKVLSWEVLHTDGHATATDEDDVDSDVETDGVEAVELELATA